MATIKWSALTPAAALTGPEIVCVVQSAASVQSTAAAIAALATNQAITVSGDLTGSGTTSIAATLATVNSNVGTFANPSLTVNGKGLVTAAATTSGVTTVTSSGASITLTWTNVTTYYVTLASATVAITHAGAVDGQKLNLVLLQDATGSRLATWANTSFGTDITTAPTLTATASKRDFIGLIYDGNASAYRMVAVARGY